MLTLHLPACPVPAEPQVEEIGNGTYIKRSGLPDVSVQPFFFSVSIKKLREGNFTVSKVCVLVT